MDASERQWRFKPGDRVLSADDEKIGKVAGFYPDAANPTHLVVERGLLRHHDYYVPVATVSNYLDDTIYLDVSKEMVLNQGWDAVPIDPTLGATAPAERTW